MAAELNHETQRLILRPWRESDAQALYEYAKDPQVGPAAGWPPHTSVENSRKIIRDVLFAPETYAVVLKETDRPAGSIGLMVGKQSSLGIGCNEGELGYWLGVPYWGRGLIPEAAMALIKYGFEGLRLTKIWCGYFEGNEKSRRVQEKCGFRYHHTNEGIECPLMGDIRTEHVACLTKEAWKKRILKNEMERKQAERSI